MFFDDYVMRQIQKIAEIVAALGARASGATYADADAALIEAYRAVLGMEPEMADRLTPDTLARLLGAPQQIEVLARLLVAHGDLCAAREDVGGARARWTRALEILAHVDNAELRGELAQRLSAP